MNNRKILNEDTEDSVIPFPLPPGKKFKDYIEKITPIEQKSNSMFYKREDKWALHGINSVNGSKCRQLLHLFETRPENTNTVIHATNVNSSPQTPMVAAFASHYNIRCIQVAGGSSFKSLNSLDLPIFATMLGTEYEIESGSGFNKNIQKRVQKIMEQFPDSFTIERDITLDHNLTKNTPDKILNFHSVGARQVENFPDFITDLILPFGSANSATSVFLGLFRYKPKSLKRIHLVNVGVDKRKYMNERLKIMGVENLNYEIIWHDTKIPYSKKIEGVSIDDITFHYRYEAKVHKYIEDNHPELITDSTLFWIIGSVPDLLTTSKILKKEIPKEIKLFDFNEKIEIDEKDIIEVKQVNLSEWGIDEKNEVHPLLKNNKRNKKPTLYYLKSGNAGGKSTIPVFLMDADPFAFKVKSLKYNKVIFTVFPSIEMVSLGDYNSGKTFGGCDGLVKEEILYSLEVLKQEKWLNYDIYFEGSMPSDTISSYFNMMKKCKKRDMVVLFLSTTYAQALDRIQARTGKSDEEMAKLKNVESKFKRVLKAKDVYRREIQTEDLDIKLLELNTDQELFDVLEDFFLKNFQDISQGEVCHV